MAVGYDESKEGFPWPAPLETDAQVAQHEQVVDAALREGSRGAAKIEREHPHVDYICIRLASSSFEFDTLRRAVHVQRALEHSYLAAGWDYAEVDPGTEFRPPYLCLGRARHPIWVVPIEGERFRVLPRDDEGIEAAAERIAREGACRVTSNGWSFLPAAQILEVVSSPVPDVESPIT